MDDEAWSKHVEEVNNPLVWLEGLDLETTQGEVYFGSLLPKRRAMAASAVGGTRRVKKQGGYPDNPTLSEVMQSPDVKRWIHAINTKLGGLKENKVFVVSDVPVRRKAIPSKLVFKVKRGPSNEIVKFKARVVVQGFRQTQGVDYCMSYAPVANATVVRVALAIGAYLDLDIEHVDFTQAFLNASLDEELYVSPPPGAPSLPPGKAWKLLLALYGTIQAPRVWHLEVKCHINTWGFQDAGFEGT
eukprot:2904817-Rhodomonas_salina.1